MIIVMDPEAPEHAVESVIAYLVNAGFDVHRSSGQSRTILGVVGEVTGNDVSVLREFDGVQEVVRVSEPFRLASRRFRQRSTVVEGAWGSIGGDRPWIAMEPVGLPPGGDPQAGAPQSELPYALAAGRPFDAAITRARRGPESIGALTCLSVHPQRAEPRWPVTFVERSPSWGANAWIGAAERELERGDTNVVLLEAGGEYPTGARTLEIAAIARAQLRTHLPIVIDVPSIAQRARYVVPVACSAMGSGADGVILRVWVGDQRAVPCLPATLRWAEAVELAEKLRKISAIVRG